MNLSNAQEPQAPAPTPNQEQAPAPQQAPQPAPTPAPAPAAAPTNEDFFVDPNAAPAPTQQPNQQTPTGNVEFKPTQVADPYEARGGVSAVRNEFDNWLDSKYPIIKEEEITAEQQKDPNTFLTFIQKNQKINNDNIRNEQARETARAEFENQIFEPVYSVYPKLREDKTTNAMVKMLYRGASASNPNISPVKVAAALSNFVRQVYTAGQKSASANRSSIPAAPAGNQGRAATKTLNQSAVERVSASGDMEAIAGMISNMQGKGVGGL